MTPGTLHALFERLFGGTDDVAKDSAHALQAAHLAADLGRGESDCQSASKIDPHSA